MHTWISAQPLPILISCLKCWTPLQSRTHNTLVLRIPWSAAVGCQLSGILTAVGIRVKLLLCCLAEAVRLSSQQKFTDKHTHMHICKSTQMHTDAYGNIKPIWGKLKDSKPQKPDAHSFFSTTMNASNQNIYAQTTRIISGVKFTHPPTQTHYTQFHTTPNMLSGVITLTHI